MNKETLGIHTSITNLVKTVNQESIAMHIVVVTHCDRRCDRRCAKANKTHKLFYREKLKVLKATWTINFKQNDQIRE